MLSILLHLWLLTWPIGLVSSVSSGLRPTTDEIPMEIVRIDGREVGFVERVWTHAQNIQNSPRPINRYEDLYYYANAHFNWVKKQRYSVSDSNSLIVASFYVPDRQTVYSSTIPRNLVNKNMAEVPSEENGPEDQKVWVWVSRTKEILDVETGEMMKNFFPRTYKFHAEDSAYYLYESLLDTPLVGSDIESADEMLMWARQTKYGASTPDGPMIAVWGEFHVEDPRAMKNKPGRRVNLCSTRNDRDKRYPCNQLADDLGVYYERVTNVSPTQIQQENDEANLIDNSGQPTSACAAAGASMTNSPSRKRWEHRGVGDYPVPRQATNQTSQACAKVSVTYAPIATTINIISANVSSTIATSGTVPSTTTTLTSDPTMTTANTTTVESTTPTSITTKRTTGTTTTETTIPQYVSILTTVSVKTVSVTTATQVQTVHNLSPTQKVILSEDYFPIGNLADSNGGADLRKDMYNKLRAACPDDIPLQEDGYYWQKCAHDDDSAVIMKDIPTIVDDGVEYFDLQFKFKASNYSSPELRDRTLALAISTWERAASMNCKSVGYKAPESDEYGCGDNGPIQTRDLTARGELEGRICDICDSGGGGGSHTTECSYEANLCTAPDFITSIVGTREDQFGNWMEVELTQHNEKENPILDWLCQELVDVLEAAVLEVAPELAEAELFADVDLRTVCE